MTIHHVHRTTFTPWLGRALVGCLAVLLITSVVPGTAWGRVHIGVVVPFGPFWGPYVAPYPYAYPSPPVVVQSPPAVYVQPAPQTAPAWYYCEHPQGYYPYVQQCPGGWRPVAPTPAPAPGFAEHP